MAHWRQQFADSDKAIGSHTLEKDGKYQPVVVTIEKFYDDKITGSMGTEKKRFVKLKEFKLPMICNITNYKRLEKFFNSFDESDFIGKQIVLGVEDVKVAGETMKALRFSTRPVPTTTASTKPSIADADLPKAIESIKSGAITIEKLKSTRELTSNQLKTIQNEISSK
jgi:hypothetical protein